LRRERALAIVRPQVDYTVSAHDLVRDLLSLANAEARQEHAGGYLATASDGDRDAFLGALKDVSESNLLSDTAVSLTLADLLVEVSRQTDQPRHRVLGLLARADALRIQGQFREAVAAYDQAAALARRLRDGVTWARTRTGWVLAMHYLGRG